MRKKEEEKARREMTWHNYDASSLWRCSVAGPSDVCVVVSEDLFNSLHPKSLLNPGQAIEMCSHVFWFWFVTTTWHKDCYLGVKYLC